MLIQIMNRVCCECDKRMGVKAFVIGREVPEVETRIEETHGYCTSCANELELCNY